jgi:zinc transporter, ZIP family
MGAGEPADRNGHAIDQRELRVEVDLGDQMLVQALLDCPAILGIQVGIGATISLSFVAAVFISNIPQAIASSADLAASGWGPRRLGQLWLLVVLACGVAAALGFLATDLSRAVQGDRAAALAAGGLLAMLTNSLIPFSFERGGALARAATAVGFCVSVMPS